MGVQSFLSGLTAEGLNAVGNTLQATGQVVGSYQRRVEAEKDSVTTKFQTEYEDYCKKLLANNDTSQYKTNAETWITNWQTNLELDNNYSEATKKWLRNEFIPAQMQGKTQEITGIENIANDTYTSVLVSTKADVLRTDSNLSYQDAVSEYSKYYKEVGASALIGKYNISTPESFQEEIKYDKASQNVYKLVSSNYTGEELDAVQIIAQSVSDIPGYSPTSTQRINLQAQINSTIEEMDKMFETNAETLDNSFQSTYQEAIFSNKIVDIEPLIDEISKVPSKYRLNLITTLNKIQKHNNETALNIFSDDIDRGYTIDDASLSLINDQDTVDDLVTKQLVKFGKDTYSNVNDALVAINSLDNISVEGLTITPEQRTQAKKDLLDEIKEANKDVASIQELGYDEILDPTGTAMASSSIKPKVSTNGISFSQKSKYIPISVSFDTGGKETEEPSTETQTAVSTQTTETEETTPTTVVPSTTTEPEETTPTTVVPSTTTEPEKATTTKKSDTYITGVSKEDVQRNKEIARQERTATLSPAKPQLGQNQAFIAENFSTNGSYKNVGLDVLYSYSIEPGAQKSELNKMALEMLDKGEITYEEAEIFGAELPAIQGVSEEQKKDVVKQINSLVNDLIPSNQQSERTNLSTTLKTYICSQAVEDPELFSDDRKRNVLKDNLLKIGSEKSAFNLLETAQIKGEALENPEKYIGALSTANPQDVMNDIVSGNFDCFIDNTLQNEFGSDVPKDLRGELYTDENLRNYFATGMGFSTTDYNYLDEETDKTGVKRLLIEYNVLYAKTKRAIAEAFTDTFNDLTGKKKGVQEFNIQQFSGGFYIQDPEVKDLWWKPNQEAFNDKGITNWNYAIARVDSDIEPFFYEGNFGEFDSNLAEEIMEKKSASKNIEEQKRKRNEAEPIYGITGISSYLTFDTSQKENGKTPEEKERDLLIKKIFSLRQSLVPVTSGGIPATMSLK